MPKFVRDAFKAVYTSHEFVAAVFGIRHAECGEVFQRKSLTMFIYGNDALQNAPIAFLLFAVTVARVVTDVCASPFMHHAEIDGLGFQCAC